MSKRRRAPNQRLLPLEVLLIGAWISLVVVVRVALANHSRLVGPAIQEQVLPVLSPVPTPDRLQAFRFAAEELDRGLAFGAGVAETFLGLFLVLMALRRQARGPGLLLPFAALALALLFVLYLIPETARLGRTVDLGEGLFWFRSATAWLELAKVLVLFGMFVSSWRALVNRR